MLKMNRIKMGTKCLSLICVVVVGLLYVQYLKYTRSTNFTNLSSSPTKKHSSDEQIDWRTQLTKQLSGPSIQNENNAWKSQFLDPKVTTPPSVLTIAKSRNANSSRKSNFIDPIVTKQRPLPTIAKSRDQRVAWKSHFIYQLPKNLKLVSLVSPGQCPNGSETITETCQGKACLCNKNSPIITCPTYKDNSQHSEDFMLEAERESLQTKRVTDLKTLPSVTETRVKVLHRQKTYKIGDKIRIIVTLVNGYGKTLLRGGDDIRVSMIEKRSSSAIAGTVNDYKNGTYLITIPVLWEGTNTITISMNYYQEERAAIFRWYRQFGVLFYHYGQFKNKKAEQYTLCATSPDLNGYKEICNMTLYNDGDPWYCGKPPSKTLGCNDIIKSFDHRFIDLPVTAAEKLLFRRTCTDKNRVLPLIQIQTKGGKYDRDRLPKCTKVNPVETWKTDEPSGYFNRSNYYSTRCRYGSSRPNITQCLQNTSLILHGDSTVFQWIKLLKRLSGCTLNKKYTSGKWYEELVCEKTDWRFTLKFAPHNMPFSCFLNTGHKVAPATKSIETALNEIPTTGRTIFVVHFGAHFTRQHYNVFRHNILRLKSSLKKALSRNKNLTILIKSPHMTRCVPWAPSVNDALLPHLITMLIDELTEYSDRVYYLNYYDMSVAVQNKDIHAREKIIKNMIETMLFYTCK